MKVVVAKIIAKYLLILCVASGIAASYAYAEEYPEGDDANLCVASDENCCKIGDWEIGVAIGLGGRTNPLSEGDDQPIVIVPEFSWYGKRFFLENFEFGFTFVDTPNHMLNVLVQPGFEHTYFENFGLGNISLEGGLNFSFGAAGGGAASSDRPPVSNDPAQEPVEVVSGPELFTAGDFTSNPIVDTPESLPETPVNNSTGRQAKVNADEVDRDIAFLGGAEYSFYYKNGLTQIQLLRDVSGVHDGSEVRVSSSWQWMKNNNRVTVAAGVNWQSEELLDYYFGLEEGEIADSNASYDADAGVSTFAEITYERRLSSKWSFLSTIQYKKLDASLLDSPLIETTGVTTLFIGGGYHF